MRGGALVCELHAHTAWSDGDLSLGVVVDLYGMAGFDVHCVSDHVLRSDDPWPLRHGRPCLDATNVGAYLAERERTRALSAYGLLLVPGPRADVQRPEPGPRRSRSRTAQPRRHGRWAGRCDGDGAHSGRGDSRRPPARLRADADRPVPTVLLRAVPAGAARALRSRGALQRA